ncbi:molybdopterin molybdotransferase MoeA [Phytohalomonas tamaricis]|uniref:molybdopterin molybdotransferase MoeA n=1 Tax=Phytohalomonas tamaricis TaxID=2081032 RepID=UPI000D0AC9A8|nr:gephyrin-like molybdotransferase Glp [Phytohalomonas tamaricis]
MAELHDIETALATLLSDIVPLATELLPLEQAAGRVLAETLYAKHDMPPANNSAMDGYALRAADAGKRLPISQRILAGHAPSPLVQGSCARIFTGGVLPEGADSVVMQENVEVEGNEAFIPTPVEVGNNVRYRGREICAGEPLMVAGERINAAGLGFLASQGIASVNVSRRPRVALLSTGDELIMPGQALAPGQIYNSNRFMLTQMLHDFGAEVMVIDNVIDTFEATRDALKQAAQETDIVVTSGGVSVGEADHVRPAVAELGQIDLWRLAIRPGKPLAMGRIGKARFIGLAGNPVSSFVGSWLFLRPLLGRLMGCPAMQTLPELSAQANFSTRTAGRTHYMRVKVHFDNEGIRAEAYDDQDSSVLRSCVYADALAVIPAHTEISRGDRVRCLHLLA